MADRHPDTVADLRQAYEGWWADISKRFDEYCEIVVGSEKENPSMLCCHDWHGERALSGQDMVRRGEKANGFWAIEVARAGKYEMTLRQQPAQAKFPIEADKARLKIGAMEMSQAGAGGRHRAWLSRSNSPPARRACRPGSATKATTCAGLTLSR